MSVALRARQPPSKPHHGKFIYLFSNLKTNQVIYSLEKEIHTERQERVLLKQLPFYGKKTVPTKLRKDLWKPFATVTFPRADDGLHAFKLLKEYRVVRDHAWTFAPTEADVIKAEQQLLDENKASSNDGSQEGDDGSGDGGSSYYGLAKIPTQYDNVLAHYTRWPDRKERIKLLMDQRATSVADLAHIIDRQRNPPARSFAARDADRQRAKLWAKITALAATDPAEIQKLEDERADLQQAAAATTHHAATAQGHGERAKLKRRAKRIDEITTRLNRLRKAGEAVAFAAGAGDDVVPESQRQKWSKTLKYIVQMQDPSRPVVSSYDREAADARRAEAAHARPTNWPRSTKFDGAGTPKMLTRRDRIALRGAAPEVDGRADKGLPDDAVLVQWANLPDAQFAASWHASVVHEPMEDRYVRKANRAYERLEGARLNALEEDGVDEDGLRDRYAAPSSRQADSEKPAQGGGWLGAVNPMRLFRGGSGTEARP